MADNYLEKRYDEVFGTKKVTKRVGHTLDDQLRRICNPTQVNIRICNP